MKTAQQVAEKYASRAGAAASDYVSGVETTTKDQAARAIASAEIHKQATMAALNEVGMPKVWQKPATKLGKTASEKKEAVDIQRVYRLLPVSTRKIPPFMTEQEAPPLPYLAD